MIDDDLGSALRSMLDTVDPVPAEALVAARAAIGWLDLKGDLATLTADSAAGKELAHVRGSEPGAGLAPPRLLTFSAGEATIDVEISAEVSGVRLIGQLDPPAAVPVTVQSAAGSVTGMSDARGRFAFDRLTGGRMRVLAGPGGSARHLTTEWFGA